MKITIKKWGNSAALRIPSAVLETVRLQLNDVVELREEEGRIIIEPLQQKTFALEDLLKGITSKNVHHTIDFGVPKGKEVW